MVIQLLFPVATIAQFLNVSTPILLAAITLAGIVIDTSGRPKSNSKRPS